MDDKEFSKDLGQERYQVYRRLPGSEEYVFVGACAFGKTGHGNHEPQKYLSKDQAYKVKDELEIRGIDVVIVNDGIWTGLARQLRFHDPVNAAEDCPMDSESSGVIPVQASIQTGSD